MIARFRHHYGATPLHLLLHLLAFAAFIWAFHDILGGGEVINYITWFVGAAVLHDIALLPFYSLLDRVTRREGRRAWGPQFLPIINYLRAPAIISAILLAVYSPLILGYSNTDYHTDTGHTPHGYLRNWLLITAGLYLTSALTYTARHTHTRLLNDEKQLTTTRDQHHS